MTERAPSSANHPSGAERLIVAIDGPAGTGKSSVAREAAHRLDLRFLDTGAMYRAAVAVAFDRGVDPLDERAVSDLADQANLHFDWSTDPPTLLAFGRSVMDRLREPDVEAAVSAVSALPSLRAVLVDLQRRIAAESPRLLTEGRDQGSVVFPDADVKIYLDASIDARAARRVGQLRSLGRSPEPSAVRHAIAERDRQDMSRPVGALVRPRDAAFIDTSDLAFDDVVDEVVRTVRRIHAREHEGKGLAGAAPTRPPPATLAPAGR